MQLFNYHQISGWVVLISARPSAFHGVKGPFRLDNLQPFKTIYGNGWPALPNIPCHDPPHFASLIKLFRRDVMQIVNNVQINGWSCSPKHDPAQFTVFKHFLVWIVLSFSNTIKIMAGPCSPKHGPVSFTVLKNFFSSGCFAAIQNHSSLWLGRAPQHPLSRPSSFCGVEESFRFDVMQIVNNLQNNGWSCSPKHDPAHFTVSKHFLVWMVWNFSKTFEFIAGPCSPKHGPALFTVLKNLFVWMLCSHLETFKFMIWLRSPTSFATAQLVSRRWTIFS